MRENWERRLRFAAGATLAELIVPTAQTFCTIDPQYGRLETLDVLRNIGLPQIRGCLHPLLHAEASTWQADEQLLVFAHYDKSGSHRFAMIEKTGEIVKISDRYAVSRVHVNETMEHFVNMAWAYFHIEPVLFEMQHSGTDEIPFADHDEEQAVKDLAWKLAIQRDPSVDDPAKTFWWGAIWAYL